MFPSMYAASNPRRAAVHRVNMIQMLNQKAKAENQTSATATDSNEEAGDQVCKRGNEPELFDSIRRSNLILVNGKLTFTVTEIDFDFPACNIQIQNFFIRKSCICADECTQSFLFPKRLRRI